MRSVRDHVRNIVEEFARLEADPRAHSSANTEFPYLSTVEAGDGIFIRLSQEIDNEIGLAADRLMSDFPGLPPKVTQTEWRKLVRRAFGPALVAIDLECDPAQNVEAVLHRLKATLENHIDGLGSSEFAFGCTLFGNLDTKPFKMGPVRFEPRLDWLARKRQDGAVSAITRRRVEKLWAGGSLRKRMPSLDSSHERNVVEAIGGCPFVCSVATDGLAPDFAREKALTAARLATAAIALLWPQPSTALMGMNLLFDRQVHRQTVLTFIPDRLVLAGHRLASLPQGPWLNHGEWESQLAQNEDYFRLIGKILDYVLDVTGTTARPQLMNTLAQALLWFYEGCRETVTLMAIVKYSAALDALAVGGTSGGIQRLISARLEIQKDTVLASDGRSMKQVVEEIYSKVRSRTIHGTNDKLGHDWTGTKRLSERLTQACLHACIDWAISNPTTEDPRELSK